MNVTVKWFVPGKVGDPVIVRVSPPVLLDVRPGGRVPTVQVLPDGAIVGPLATMDQVCAVDARTSEGDKAERTTAGSTVRKYSFVTVSPSAIVNVTSNEKFPAVVNVPVMVRFAPPVLLEVSPGGSVPTVQVLPDGGIGGPMAVIVQVCVMPTYPSSGDKSERVIGGSTCNV